MELINLFLSTIYYLLHMAIPLTIASKFNAQVTVLATLGMSLSPHFCTCINLFRKYYDIALFLILDLNFHLLQNCCTTLINVYKFSALVVKPTKSSANIKPPTLTSFLTVLPIPAFSTSSDNWLIKIENRIGYILQPCATPWPIRTVAIFFLPTK